MIFKQSHKFPLKTHHESTDWIEILNHHKNQPHIKYNSNSFMVNCAQGNQLFADLPLYTLCDGAGGVPLGLMTQSRYRDLAESLNHDDISSYLYIAHPFLAHYCQKGSELLKILHTSGYSHSSNPKDFNLFHYLCGAKNTYTQIHNHATATALLFEGMKEWWLAPSTVENAKLMQPLFMDRVWHVYREPGGSLAEWLEIKSSAVSSIEDLVIVLQPPSTSLYIPDKWYHGVLNHAYSSSITLSWDYQ